MATENTFITCTHRGPGRGVGGSARRPLALPGKRAKRAGRLPLRHRDVLELKIFTEVCSQTVRNIERNSTQQNARRSAVFRRACSAYTAASRKIFCRNPVMTCARLLHPKTRVKSPRTPIPGHVTPVHDIRDNYQYQTVTAHVGRSSSSHHLRVFVAASSSKRNGE